MNSSSPVHSSDELSSCAAGPGVQGLFAAVLNGVDMLGGRTGLAELMCPDWSKRAIGELSAIPSLRSSSDSLVRALLVEPLPIKGLALLDEALAVEAESVKIPFSLSA